MVGAVLALASALVYGVADFVGGLAARRADATSVAMLGQLGALVTTGIAAPLVGADAVGLADLGWGALSGVGTGLGMVFLYRGISRADMSVVVPVSAVASVALSVLIGVLLLGNRPGALAWVGILVTGPALWLVSRDGGNGGTGSSAAGYGLAASVGIAVQYLALAQAAPAAGIWPVFAGRVTAVLAVGLAAHRAGVGLRMRRREAVTAVVTGVLIALGLTLYALASQHQVVAIAVVLASLYPAIPVLLALTVLRERVSRTQGVGLLGAGLAIPLLTIG